MTGERRAYCVVCFIASDARGDVTSRAFLCLYLCLRARGGFIRRAREQSG